MLGLSVAFHLAERGVGRIVVYEREGVGAGASGVQPGGVRQQWSTRLNCSMARASLGFYTQLRERLQPRVDPAFRACGYLFVAHERSTLERLGADVALQNEVGVPSRLLTAAEAVEVAAGLLPDGVLGAAYCHEDGYFDLPQAVVAAFAEAARRLGAAVERREVRALEPTTVGWRLTFADGSRAEAGRVVVAAAVATRALLQPLGVDLPIASENRWLHLSEPIAERLLDPLVVAVDRRFAAKQLADGRLLASDLVASDGDPTRARECLRDLLPALAAIDLPMLVQGEYDATPDHQAIVGPLPDHDGLYVAAGTSGHGFMMAPELGRGVAAMVLGEDPGEAFRALRPGRFEAGTLVRESAVV